MTVQLSHVSKGTELSQAEFESASSHTLDGDLNLGANKLVGNGGSTGIAISANGEVNMAAQPCVLAYNSAADNNVTGDATTFTIIFDTEIFDQNADFDGASTFTAPITGRYLVVAHVNFSGVVAGHRVGTVDIVASNRTFASAHGTLADQVGTSGQIHCVNSTLVDMDVSDTFTVTVSVNSGTKVIDIAGGVTVPTRLSVQLVA